MSLKAKQLNVHFHPQVKFILEAVSAFMGRSLGYVVQKAVWEYCRNHLMNLGSWGNTPETYEKSRGIKWIESKELFPEVSKVNAMMPDAEPLITPESEPVKVDTTKEFDDPLAKK